MEYSCLYSEQYKAQLNRLQKLTWLFEIKYRSGVNPFPLRHTGQTWSVLSIKSQEREENNIADAIVAESFGHWYGDLAAAKAAALESVMDRVVEAGSLLY